MTIGLGFVISVCDYVNGNSDKSLDEITEKILSKVHPCDLQDFFEKIALFSSRNNRYQELKANCESRLGIKDGEATSSEVTVCKN
ncbi:MAG: hypothetical protein ABSF44_08475 [Candidatus Bathyarchaeia archaeon]